MMDQTVDRTMPAARREVATIDNPFGASQSAAASALVSIEQQRAIAEVQARMIIARANPRNPIKCMDAILRQCTRPSLAAKGLYAYSRGGSEITGPSIRLAEAMAQSWGNIASGIKEVARNAGYSECVAYAWDLETGYYDERQFQVKHWRDTKQGGYALKDERDIYELIANMGQRRKRAVLLTVIPGDVADAATAQCEETLAATADTSPDAVQRLVQAFAPLGVTKEQIEKRIQRRIESILPAQVLQLRKVWSSINDEMSTPGDWFEVDDPLEREKAAVEAMAQAGPAAPQVTPPAARRSSRRAAAEAPPAAQSQPAAAASPSAAAQPTPPAAEDASLDQDGLFLDNATRQEPDDSAEDGFAVYLVVPDGPGRWRETTDNPITDPVHFANMVADQFPADLEAIFAENADAIDAAEAASEAARNVLTRIRGMMATPKPAVAAPKPIDPDGFRTPQNGFHGGNYRAACQAELDKLGTDEAITGWEMLNAPVYNRSITAKAEATRAIRAARTRVAGQQQTTQAAPTPPAEPSRQSRRVAAPSPVDAALGRQAAAETVDKLARSADSIIDGLKGHPNKHSVVTFIDGPAFKHVKSACAAGDRMDLVAKITQAETAALQGPFTGD